MNPNSSHNRNMELRAFDEQKTGVKGLVDRGAEKIPTIFVRPGEDISRELKSSDDESLVVPVIDLCVGDDEEREEMARRVMWASEKWGFFQVVNHGVPLEVMERVMEGVRRFHEEDGEVKKEYYGRDGMKQVRFNTNYDLYHSRAANWRDTLYVTTVFKPQLDPNQLPPICRDAILEYVEHVAKLGDLLVELLSVGLGLEPQRLKEMGSTRAWNMSGHYYPACPEPDLTLGASKHSDPSFLTLLLQDHIGGLQVLHQNRWVNVKPIHGAFIVNTGDILQIISNDKLKSVHHRVIANKIGPRISIATFLTGFFSSPKMLGPIQELLSEENPPLYREFTVQEFLKHFFAKPLDQPGIEHFRLTS